MKKRIIGIIAIALVSICIFISCSADGTKAEKVDKTGSVTFFESSNSRALADSYVDKEFDELYWYYTASMTGSNGAKVENLVKIKGKGEKGIVDSTISGFSEGEWTFTIYGFSVELNGADEDGATTMNQSSAESSDKLVYEGTSGSTKVVADTSVDVIVAVKAVQKTGILRLDDVKFEYNTSNTLISHSGMTPVILMTLTNSSDNTEKYTFTTSCDAVTEGAHTSNNVKIKGVEEGTTGVSVKECSVKSDENIAETFEGAIIPVGTYNISFTVHATKSQSSYNLPNDGAISIGIYGNSVTTISGTIKETQTGSVTFKEGEVKVDTTDSNTHSATGNAGAEDENN